MNQTLWPQGSEDRSRLQQDKRGEPPVPWHVAGWQQEDCTDPPWRGCMRVNFHLYSTTLWKRLCVNVSTIPLTKVVINIILFLRTQIYMVRMVLKGFLSQGRQAL